MGIHSAIASAKFRYEMETGKQPKRVYLGDEEITALLSWAREYQYIATEPHETNIKGDHRPEVDGMLVYVVNDTSHLQCG